MRTSDSPDPTALLLARYFLIGALAGLTVLTVFLLENVANLGYAVLTGGLWALLGLIGSFGLSFGCFAIAFMLTAAAFPPALRVMRPARSRYRKPPSAPPHL